MYFVFFFWLIFQIDHFLVTLWSQFLVPIQSNIGWQTDTFTETWKENQALNKDFYQTIVYHLLRPSLTIVGHLVARTFCRGPIVVKLSYLARSITSQTIWSSNTLVLGGHRHGPLLVKIYLCVAFFIIFKNDEMK